MRGKKFLIRKKLFNIKEKLSINGSFKRKIF